MSKKWTGISIVALAVLAVAWAGATAAENVWVSDDGNEVKIDTAHKMMFFGDEDAETFDVSELADGETRTFGEGENVITVTRAGDEVTLSHADGGDAHPSVVCRISSDTCQIIEVDGDPGRTMVMIKKERDCEHGDEDCGAMALAHVSVGDAGLGQIVITKTITCDDEGNCDESEDAHHLGHEAHGCATIDILTDGEGSADLHDIMVLGGGHAGAKVIQLDGSGQVTLRCPEGDATMRVDENEAGETYLCPKHSVPLEKVEGLHGAHRIMIRQQTDEDAD